MFALSFALLFALSGATSGAQGAPQGTPQSAMPAAADGPVLGAAMLHPGAALKVWLEDGQVRLVAWDRDSIVVRGNVGASRGFFFSGGADGMKFGIEKRDRSRGRGTPDIVAYIPRTSPVSVKSVSATIEAAGLSGWFYTVSGAIHLSGRASSIEAESMNGNLDLDVATPWLRARTGAGHLLLRGAPEDVDVSTISGTLDVAATTVRRGQFGSVSGDIHYAGALVPDGIVEFSNHSGNVELLLPRKVSADFALTSIAGSIDNGFARAQPIAGGPRTLRVSLGRGGSQVTVRTFRGTIRLRAR